jgi:hypothetical protein
MILFINTALKTSNPTQFFSNLHNNVRFLYSDTIENDTLMIIVLSFLGIFETLWSPYENFFVNVCVYEIIQEPLNSIFIKFDIGEF